ncbi:hypothetical protein [Bifidobacterium callitrichidarum]|uniref:NERD domain-containing protein n=1 Tax=Bifidobacterium callitrichidarum TaxID=2052941 RepID=A0A2U2NC40_9BIFI|nr:hypothetical protein [Bifidobacterium callitrichidarum]PWG66715.1 hypothetical protein DF196_02090 [Bifidobacterium callitrichidarum]
METIPFGTAILWSLEDAFGDLYSWIDFAIIFIVALAFCHPWGTQCGYRLMQEPRLLGESEEDRKNRLWGLEYDVDHLPGYQLRRAKRIVICLIPAFIVHVGLHGVVYRNFVSPHPSWGFRFFSLFVALVGVFLALIINATWQESDYNKAREMDPRLSEYSHKGVQTGVEAAAGQARLQTTATDTRPNAPDNMKPYDQRPKTKQYKTGVYSLQSIADAYEIPQAQAGEESYKGYRMVDKPGDGMPDPLLEAASDQWFTSPRKWCLMYGNPGGGLKSSHFGMSALMGATGEKDLAKIITHEKMNVISFWSLYGLDKNLKHMEADIDCVLAGIDSEGTVHLWFVDAKNYAGGSDVVYVPSDEENMLLRVSKSKHAFVKGYGDSPSLKMSSNMAYQADNWKTRWMKIPGMPNVFMHWRVCSVPTGKNGTPEFHDSLQWPGGIKAVTVRQLLDEIKAVDLQEPAHVPMSVVELLKTFVKPNDDGTPATSPANADKEQQTRFEAEKSKAEWAKRRQNGDAKTEGPEEVPVSEDEPTETKPAAETEDNDATQTIPEPQTVTEQRTTSEAGEVPPVPLPPQTEEDKPKEDKRKPPITGNGFSVGLPPQN